MSVGRILNNNIKAGKSIASQFYGEVICPQISNIATYAGHVWGGAAIESYRHNLVVIGGSIAAGLYLAKQARNLQGSVDVQVGEARLSAVTFLAKKVALYSGSLFFLSLAAYETYATITELHGSSLRAEEKRDNIWSCFMFHRSLCDSRYGGKYQERVRAHYIERNCSTWLEGMGIDNNLCSDDARYKLSGLLKRFDLDKKEF